MVDLSALDKQRRASHVPSAASAPRPAPEQRNAWASIRWAGKLREHRGHGNVLSPMLLSPPSPLSSVRFYNRWTLTTRHLFCVSQVFVCWPLFSSATPPPCCCCCWEYYVSFFWPLARTPADPTTTCTLARWMLGDLRLTDESKCRREGGCGVPGWEACCWGTSGPGLVRGSPWPQGSGLMR